MTSAKRILKRLLKEYPHPKIALHFTNPIELLVATMLSAQCTDARVNEVTQRLFKRYKKAKDYAEADLNAFEQAIRPTGFYKNKAKAVIGCCQQLVADHGGKVPDSVEALSALRGVGRKTANMVIGNAFGVPAIAVDTHVLRVSQRLGLTEAKNADKAEEALMEQIPRESWTDFANAMILHGRQVCTARKPHCCECGLYRECEWVDKPECL